MRKLATIQKILKLETIEGADMIERATVLGWHLVVKKGEFKEGDLCIYFEVDCFLPVVPQFEFLAKSGTKKILIDQKEIEGYRLKTIRLRGQVSQGLALPIGSFADKLKIQEVWKEGREVTDKLGVVKYEPQMPAQLSGVARSGFPGFIPKTDEERIQNLPSLLETYKDVPFYVSEKLDGSSTTIFFRDGELHVCSRSLDLMENEGNTFWKVARILKLEEKLGKHPNYALQGELVGENIQKNTLKITGHKIYFYNIYDMSKDEYLSMNDFVDACRELEIETVPIVDKELFLFKTVDEMVKHATFKSYINNDGWAEGHVIRPLQEMHDPDLGRLSFKVINPEFLLKYNE